MTTLVPVDAVAGVAAADDAADEVDAAGEAVAAGGTVVAGDAVAAVELLVLVVGPEAVEPEDVVPGVPAVAAIPKAAPRNPPIDRMAAATLARLAGWRRRAVPWS